MLHENRTRSCFFWGGGRSNLNGNFPTKISMSLDIDGPPAQSSVYVETKMLKSDFHALIH